MEKETEMLANTPMKSTPPIDSTLALSMVSPGQRVTVVGMTAGRQTAHRLAEMGLSRGSSLHIVQNNGSSLLVAVSDTRLALGRGLAHSIRVLPE
jgi:ferrous iron transport protein A